MHGTLWYSNSTDDEEISSATSSHSPYAFVTPVVDIPSLSHSHEHMIHNWHFHEASATRGDRKISTTQHLLSTGALEGSGAIVATAQLVYTNIDKNSRIDTELSLYVTDKIVQLQFYSIVLRLYSMASCMSAALFLVRHDGASWQQRGLITNSLASGTTVVLTVVGKVKTGRNRRRSIERWVEKVDWQQTSCGWD